jgi:putative flippase GtrA
LCNKALINSGWAPLTANGIAFLTAFIVSFLGHLSFSFAQHQAHPVAAMWRFACVALMGFGLNHAILSTMLHLSHMSTMLALSVATSTAATLSFALSRQWAFRRHAAE